MAYNNMILSEQPHLADRPEGFGQPWRIHHVNQSFCEYSELRTVSGSNPEFGRNVRANPSVWGTLDRPEAKGTAPSRRFAVPGTTSS